MIPLGDELPTERFPWANYLIIATTIAAWFLVQGAGMNAERLAATVCDFGLVPGEITHQAPLGFGIPISPRSVCVIDNYTINYFTPLISIFLHGGWLHLGGNMLFLWVFGDNIEDAMGPIRYIVFYLICGVAAGVAHIISQPASPIPTVGASGAISGIMGAYLVLYPTARVRIFFFIFVARVHAWLVLAYWFGLQLLEGFSRLSPIRPEVSSGVAVWAHVGGFVTGLTLISFFRVRPAVARAYPRR